MSKRTELFERLRAEQPEMLEVLTEVRRVFGKTPTPTIRLGGEMVWSPALALRERRGESWVDWKARQ